MSTSKGYRLQFNARPSSKALWYDRPPLKAGKGFVWRGPGWYMGHPGSGVFRVV